jgi:hypothetical protein
MPTIGLGPHGERPFAADQLILTEAEAELVRGSRVSAAIVLHTTTSDWSRQELAGIIAALGQYGATVSEIVDCGFDKDKQNRELLRLAAAPTDAIISLPIGSSGVVEAHRAVGRAGKKLVLLDNAPPSCAPASIILPSPPPTISVSARSPRSSYPPTPLMKASSASLIMRPNFSSPTNASSPFASGWALSGPTSR